ncbi:MAG: hypothetical protein LBT60_03670 [Oscillospiraceae bacterium]|nr:hypothetical protein [Oscillospiraceae bacterium]
MLYKLLAALAAPLANEGLGQLLTAVSGAFGLILGMTGAASLLLFISLISMIAGGQAL